MSSRYIEVALDGSFGSVLGRDNIGTIVMVTAIICLGILYAIVRYSALKSDIGPMTYVATRFLFGAVIMGLFQGVTQYLDKGNRDEVPNAHYWRDVALWGGLVGIFLFGFSIALQYGEKTQSAAQTSFIVGMYVVVIPFLELIISGCKHHLSWISWIAIAIDIPGLILVSGCAESNCFESVEWGTLINMVGMLCVAAHTLTSAFGVKSVGSGPVLMTSFCVCAVIATILALIIETDQWKYPCTEITSNWYLIISSSFAETLCAVCITVALAFLSTSRAAIIMSTESLSGAVFGFIILGEVSWICYIVTLR